jgi:hypothetical protein
MKKAQCPPFFSIDFHVKFFPALLWRLLHPRNRKYESTFAGHISLELPVITVVSLALGIYGVTAVIDSGTILGWVCGIAGLGGFSYLLTSSIRSTLGMDPSFDYFHTIIFLFFVFLGLTIGLEMGIVYRLTSDLKFIAGLTGFILGYVTGIFAGLWVQKLGWIASLLDIIALTVIAGMIVLDIVILM